MVQNGNNSNADEEPATWTLRLSADQDDAVEQLAKRRGCSKNKAVRYLVDNIDLLENYADQLDELANDVNEIKDAHGLNGADDPAVVPAQDTGTDTVVDADNDVATPVQGQPASTTSDATIPAANGEVIILSQLDPTTKKQINPFDGPFNDEVDQVVAQREGVLAACINYMRANGNKEMERRRLESLVQQVFPDYGPQSVDERTQGLIDKEVVLVNPARDPQFADKRDDILRNAYDDDYETFKDKRDLPTNWADMLEGFWRQYGDNVLYLDPARYAKELIRQVEKLTDKYVTFRGTRCRSKKKRARRDTFKFALREFTKVVEDRLWRLMGPNHGFDAEAYYAGMVKVVMQDVDASEVSNLSPYFNQETGDMDVKGALSEQVSALKTGGVAALQA